MTQVSTATSVVSIGDSAFQQCVSLRTVDLPSVHYLGQSACAACANLSEINLSGALTFIGASAFRGCNALTYMVVPDAVTYIGASAFYSIPETQDSISSSPSQLREVELSDAVTYIESEAFRQTSLQSVVIPRSVTYIGSSAFSQCTSLNNITIQGMITALGPFVFSECANLTHVDIPFVHGTGGTVFRSCGSNVFDGCKKFTSMTVPSTTTELGTYAFENCSTLTTLHKPDSLTVINEFALIDLSLQTMTTPDSVTRIDRFACSHCASLKTILLSNALTYIGRYAFQSCTKLTTIRVPASVGFVGENAFYGCYLCRRDDLVSYNSGTETATFQHVSFIGRYSFYNCDKLKWVYIPDSVQTLMPTSLSFSIRLNNVVIPNSVTRIEPASFQGCVGLTTITIPHSTYIVPGTPGAFSSCGCPEALYASGTALQNTKGYIKARVWTPWTVCNSTTQYQSVPNMYTSDCKCVHLTQCTATQYESSLPTLTADRKCTALRQCAIGVEASHTATTDRVCSDKRHGLTGAQGAAIAISVESFVILVVTLSMYFLHRSKKRAQKSMHLRERLLQDERAEKLTLYAENTEMKRAWEIAEDDLDMECVIASGASASVWRAKWGHIDVAVKVLKHPIDDDFDPLAGEEFNREVLFMQRLRHPNLLTFYGAGVTSEHFAFMVVELMDEGSMRSVLRSPRTLSRGVRMYMALDVARGMHKLHVAGCIHRNLKSDNCLVDGDLRVKVGDFGASRLLDARRAHTAMTTLDHATEHVRNSWTSLVGTSDTDSIASASMTTGVGTPLWMAPELIAQATDYGGEVDVYSFGIVLWELLTRATPWESEITCRGIGAAGAIRDAVSSGRRPMVWCSATFDEPDTRHDACSSVHTHALTICVLALHSCVCMDTFYPCALTLHADFCIAIPRRFHQTTTSQRRICVLCSSAGTETPAHARRSRKWSCSSTC